MVKVLIWSEENEIVYGREAEFESVQEFIDTVSEQYEGGACEVTDIKIKTCIYSEETIPGDQIIPLQLLNIVIENYYTASVNALE